MQPMAMARIEMTMIEAASTPLVEDPVDKPKVTKDRAPPLQLQGRLGR